MNMPTKWAFTPLFADKLAKFAAKILLHGQNSIAFEKFFLEGVTPPHPTVAPALGWVSCYS